MTDKKICYRDVRQYKYQLVSDYTQATDIIPEKDISLEYLSLNTQGELFIKERYAWDGPSGPTIDTNTFMRGSLVHDALYQLLRSGHLKPDYRQTADELLKKINIEDGMNPFRAWYVHKGLAWFGERNAELQQNTQDTIICAP